MFEIHIFYGRVVATNLMKFNLVVGSLTVGEDL